METRAQHLQRSVRDHMLLNFTDLGAFENQDIPIFVRGEGCEVIDINGRRFIDGLSGLFCTNLGHSYGDRIGAAGHAALANLVFTPSWSITHPGAADLAERITGLAEPLNLNRVFFTSGGGESVEAAWKLARQWHAANGEPQRRKAISRKLAYHGTSLGALSFTGLPDCRWPFEPLAVPVDFVSNTNAYRHPDGDDEARFTAALLAEIEDAIQSAGPDQVAMFIAEPLQNSGGAFTPPAGYFEGVREICDRHGILLVVDETICGFGRVGEWFASIRYNIKPDMLTFAKGATAGHAPFGGVLINDRVSAPFVSGEHTYMHGLTWSGHPLSTAIASETIDIYEEVDALARVREHENVLSRKLNELRRIPLVGDVRGAGFFWAIEMVKDRNSKATFEGAEADWLLRDEMSDHMSALGLLCRLDDRGDPVIQLSPPLVADEALLDRMVNIVGSALEGAWSSWQGRAAA